MIDVHLIGYTADLQHLVLDLDGGANGRYRVLVDADLFATLDELRDERRAAGLPVGDLEEFLDEDELEALHGDDVEVEHAPEAEDATTDDEPEVIAELDEEDDELDLLAEVERDRLDAEATDASDESDDEPSAEVISENVRLVTRRPEPEPAPDPEPVVEDEQEPEPEPDVGEIPAPAASRFEDAAQPSRRPATAGETRPKLSPAQIQTLLRAGKSPRTVAREAGTDIAWIERWLPPILAERTRVLERAHAKSLDRPRLGSSRDPLGKAVERNLKAKGVADDDLTWDVGRRNDGRWKVSVKFSQRGRSRTATWTYDPTDDELRAASELAKELGFTRTKRAASGKRSAAKRPAAKKSAAKKSAAKKSSAKKSAAKKSSAKKSSAKKSAAKKSAAKGSAAKESAAKKPAAKKSTAKKPAAKESTAKGSAAKRSSAESPTSAKRTAARTSPSSSVPEKDTTPTGARSATQERAAGQPQKATPIAPPWMTEATADPAAAPRNGKAGSGTSGDNGDREAASSSDER